MMKVHIHQSWAPWIGPEFDKEYVKKIASFLRMKESENIDIYPPRTHIFKAFELTPWDEVKVVIIGQDPYHGPRQATGLAFAVPPSVPPPPSLRNILKEVYDETGVVHTDSSLISWAQQGVLLLNRILTVEAHRPLSHQNIGWKQFTYHVIRSLQHKKDPICFVLWGQTAQNLKSEIGPPHHILTAPHPSPLSAHRGFFGCGHFRMINHLLEKASQPPIRW